MAQISYPDPTQIPEPLAGMLAAVPSVAAIDMLAHSPVLAEHFLRLAHAQFTALELPERARAREPERHRRFRPGGPSCRVARLREERRRQ